MQDLIRAISGRSTTGLGVLSGALFAFLGQQWTALKTLPNVTVRWRLQSFCSIKEDPQSLWTE
jgi:hypothetical protein